MAACGQKESAPATAPVEPTDSLAFSYGEQFGARINGWFAAMPPEKAAAISKTDYLRGFDTGLRLNVSEPGVFDGFVYAATQAEQFDGFADAGIVIDRQRFMEAFSQTLRGGGLDEATTAETQALYDSYLERARETLLERRRADRRDQAATTKRMRTRNIEAARTYILNLTKEQPNIKESKSGLYYVTRLPGRGRRPSQQSTADAIYRPTTLGGREISSSNGESASLKVADLPAKGLAEAITMMREGEKSTFYIPDFLGFEPEEAERRGVDPGEMLIFDVQLLSIK